MQEYAIVYYYVYILTNKNHTVLYTGVTNDLIRRVYEHKNHLDKDGFTAKYKVTKLVYFEQTSDVRAAIEREKQIKSWSRDRKIALIFEFNPSWNDLYNRLLG
jgi:putative endonuclease